VTNSRTERRTRRPREAEILRNAAEILRTGGDASLTMRAVATATEISLSNVQYYFKSKDELLEALVEDYFAECAALVEETAAQYATKKGRAKLTAFLTKVMSDDTDMKQMCAMFRELWAIATRNPQVETLLGSYYQQTRELLAATLFPEVTDKRVRKRIGLLLIPYIEGYSITGPPAGMTTRDAAALVSDLVFSGLIDE